MSIRSFLMSLNTGLVILALNFPAGSARAAAA